MKKEPVNIIGDGMALGARGGVALGAGVGIALGTAFGYALYEKRKNEESKEK